MHGHGGPCLRADGTVPTVDVGNKIAQPSASWLSGGVSQRQIVLQAALNFGQPRPLTRLAALVAGWSTTSALLSTQRRAIRRATSAASRRARGRSPVGRPRPSRPGSRRSAARSRWTCVVTAAGGHRRRPWRRRRGPPEHPRPWLCAQCPTSRPGSAELPRAARRARRRHRGRARGSAKRGAWPFAQPEEARV